MQLSVNAPTAFGCRSGPAFSHWVATPHLPVTSSSSFALSLSKAQPPLPALTIMCSPVGRVYGHRRNTNIQEPHSCLEVCIKPHLVTGQYHHIHLLTANACASASLQPILSPASTPLCTPRGERVASREHTTMRVPTAACRPRLGPALCHWPVPPHPPVTSPSQLGI